MPSVIWPYSFYTCSSEHWVNYISLGSGSFIKHFCLCELYSSPYSCLWARVKQADKITRCRNTRVPHSWEDKSDTVLACHLVFGYKHSFIYTSGFGCSSSIVADFSDVVVMEQTSVFAVDLLKAWAEMLFVKFLILTKVSYKVTNNTKSNQQVVLTH